VHNTDTTILEIIKIKVMRKLKNALRRLHYFKVLISPFKPFHIKFYAGKTRVGTPYFYPRKWINATPFLAHKATLDYIKSQEKYNELNPKHARKIKSYEEIYEDKLKYKYAVPIKIGFDSCGLGYKTKWTDTDFRYEWGPVFTFVFFGYQLAWMIGQKEPSHYWEAWLYYEYATDKSKSKKERVAQCRKEFPMIYKCYHKDPATGENTREETIDYYEQVLKTKYRK
jgi:hypothetical protein